MRILYHAIIALVIAVLVSQTNTAYATEVSSVGIATYLSIDNKQIQDGDIVISTSEGYQISTQAYDPRVIGVVTTKPAIELRNNDEKTGKPVVNQGTAFVKVTKENGEVKTGDFITTSTVKGTGMKATRSGYVIGEALQDANFANNATVILIPVSLNLRYIQFGPQTPNSLADLLSLSQIASYEQPIRVVQYIIAAIIVISSFAFGFLIFARTVNTGIQALGRNPLAGRMIQLSIVFNVVLIIIIIMTGVGLAYLVIRLA
ncbi:MAG: hypothetical protein AAB553_06160 [Patescibacteria group bacterium]